MYHQSPVIFTVELFKYSGKPKLTSFGGMTNDIGKIMLKTEKCI